MDSCGVRFSVGVAGMTKDILTTEYQAMQRERKELARAKPHSFLYEVSDLETSFLCLYENCGQFESARQKLNIAGKHLDKVAEVHARLRKTLSQTCHWHTWLQDTTRS